MKGTNNFKLAGNITSVLNASPAQDKFDKDIQAEVAFIYVKLLFESGYTRIAISLLLFDFTIKHAESRHIETVKQCLLLLMTEEKSDINYKKQNTKS